MHFLIVFLGGGIGAACRHGINLLALRTVGIAFPYGTLAINAVGSFLMGVLTAYFLREQTPMAWRLFFATGVLGGFTTFSAFSLEAALLYERGQPSMAAAYVLGSVVLAIAALFAGLALTRAFGGA